MSEPIEAGIRARMGATPLVAHERELERVARLYDALSAVTQAIICTRDRVDLCQKVCAALVEKGGFAWIHEVLATP